VSATVTPSQVPTPSAPPRALVNLPPFPAVAMRILQLLSKEDVGMKELSDLISADAVFSAEVLSLANSPLFGFRAEVKSILQATALMGLQRVKALALTVGMKAYISSAIKQPCLRACWRHSLACALAAEELAAVSLIEKDEAYTAGLMHDIGRLALIVMHPAQYAGLLSEPAEDSPSLLSRERELFEVDHCQAGQWLVEAWGLPKSFSDITARHHEPASRDAVNGKFDLQALVRTACRLADSLGFAVAKCHQVPTLPQVLEDLPQRERNKFQPDPDDLAMRIGVKINCLDHGSVF
jgi:HD-like signal output (HDOD) protein